MSSKEHSRMLRTLEQLQIDVEWVVPENIHTYTTGGISEFRRGEGVTSTGILRTWGGGSWDWNSEGMGGFSGQ